MERLKCYKQIQNGLVGMVHQSNSPSLYESGCNISSVILQAYFILKINIQKMFLEVMWCSLVGKYATKELDIVSTYTSWVITFSINNTVYYFVKLFVVRCNSKCNNQLLDIAFSKNFLFLVPSSWNFRLK